MKKLSLIFIGICLVLSLVACSSSNDDKTTEPTATTGEAEKTTEPTATTGEAEKTAESLSATDWSNMLSETTFENFTLNFSGVMTLTQEGMGEPVSADVSQEIKFTKDKLQITNKGENDSMVIEGEGAAVQREQVVQVFMVILEKYEYYVFDEETKTYKIPETVTIDTTLKAVTSDGENNTTTFDVPATIVIREAEAKISDDGKLLTLVCDFTQTMDLGGATNSASGKTTWEFSNYGTTVIE